jgi:hypothetical protein
MDDLPAARRSYQYILIVVGLLLGAMLLDIELTKFSLITPVPWIVKGSAIGLGMLAGLLLSIRVMMQHEITGRKLKGNEVFGLLALPLLFAPVGSYVGRRGFEIAAFSGSVAVPVAPMEAVIADLGSKRRQLFGPKIRLEFAPNLRDFWLSIDYRPDVTAIGLYCLKMPAERGRYGAIRTRNPTGFDTLRLNDFRPCSPSVLERNPALAERVARIAVRNEQ